MLVRLAGTSLLTAVEVCQSPIWKGLQGSREAWVTAKGMPEEGVLRTRFRPFKT